MERLLVVEDDAALLELLQITLEGQGFHVTVARDGVEAVAALQNDEPFDLVMTDFAMPNGDGLDVCLAVRNDPRISAIPIVMLTAMGIYSDPRLRDALALPNISLLKKPTTVRNLGTYLRGIIERNQGLVAGGI